MSQKPVTEMTDDELTAHNIRKSREICALKLRGGDISQVEFNGAIRVWHQENITIRNDRAKDMLELQLGHLLAKDEDELRRLLKVATPHLNVVKSLAETTE